MKSSIWWLSFALIVLPAIGLSVPTSVSADTTVGGIIDADTVWTTAGSPYIVTSNITVKGTDGPDAISTLTIEPGVIVKFNSYKSLEIGASSVVPGALNAQGSITEPIVFTSSQANPSPGDWYYVRFSNTADDATSVMTHCVVEYGGYNNGAIYLDQASPTLNHVTVRDSKSSGIKIQTGEPTIENCTFLSSQNYDLYYTGTVGGSVSGSTINSGIYLLATGNVSFSGNTIAYNDSFPIKIYPDNVGSLVSSSTFNNVGVSSIIQVTSSGRTISHDATWTAAVPYAIAGDLTVKGTDGPDGITTLTIEPGAVVKFSASASMNIGGSSGDPGALIAQGTASEPIVFTSNKTTPAPGDWYYIRFFNTADDGTTALEHCVVEYGGSGGQGALNIQEASPTLRNTIVTDSASYGIRLSTGAPIIDTCQFSANGNYDLYYSGTVGGSVTGTTINSGIYLLATGNVSFSGNTIAYNDSFPIKIYPDNVGSLVSSSTFNNVGVSSIIQVTSSGRTISHDATWTAAVPYAIAGDLTVKGTDGPDGITTLTIEPGAVVKFSASASMNIGGSSGDPGALIAQGTASEPIVFTSNKTTPAPGDWYYIRFFNTTDDGTTALEHCVVEYGGYSSGALYLYDAAPSIQNSTIRYSNSAGIYATGAGTGAAVINCNTLRYNNKGIQWNASLAPEIHSNNFKGNTSYGLSYRGATTLNAENNWWNDSAGPNQAGDKTYGNVDADPWSSTENQCVATGDNQPPDEPSTPIPANGAVRVDTSNGVDLQWTGGDPDILDTVTYDLYRGTNSETMSLLAQNIVTSTNQMPDAIAGQTYYWQIVAKDNHGLETPGPVWRFTTAGDPPDLIVSNLAVDPLGNLQQGQSVTFTAQISNVGMGPVVDALNVDLQINGILIGNLPVNAILLAGESTSVNWSWSFYGGDPSIEITADSQWDVAESNEINNKYIAILSEIADNTAPRLVGHYPVDGSYLQQVQSLHATLSDSQSTIDDASVIANFTVLDPSQQPVAGTASEVEDTFTFTPNNTPLSDGTYIVRLTAADSLGNQLNYEFSFIIDTQPPAKPVVTGSSVASGTIQPRPAANQADDFMVTLEGTRDADTSLWINGSQFVPKGSGPWAANLTLLAGDNAIEIQSVDQAGNHSPSEWVDVHVEPASGLFFDYNDAGRMQRVRRIQ